MKELYKKIAGYASSEYVAYGILVLYLVVAMISTSFFEAFLPSILMKLAFASVIGLVLVRDLLVNKQDKRSLIGWAVLLFVIVLVVRAPGLGSRVNLLSGFSLIYGLRGEQPKKLVKVALFTTAVMCFFIVMSSQLGLIRNYLEIASFRRRHYLGFRYSLFPSTFMLNITLMVIYIKQKNIRIWQILFLFLVNIWIFVQTGSRLTFISSCLSLAFISLVIFYSGKWRLSKNISEGIVKYLPLSYWFAAAVSFVVVMEYKPTFSIWAKLNSFFGQRIALSLQSIKSYGIGLFSQKVAWVGNGLDIQGKKLPGSYLFVDNMYINISQRYGLLFLILFLALLTLVIRKIMQQKQYILAFIFIIIAFHAIIDNLMFSVHYNFFWLLIGIVLLGADRKAGKNTRGDELLTLNIERN